MKSMHAGERAADKKLVRRLLSEQFPQWSHLPMRQVLSAGTDNVLFRLGTDLIVRLPRIDWAVGQIEHEAYWLPRLAPHLPLVTPLPLAIGRPMDGYPWSWAIYRWLPGKDATQAHLADPQSAARELARFVIALQSINPCAGPPAAERNERGLPLFVRDEAVRNALVDLDDEIDGEVALAAWEDAVGAAEWNRPPVWFHGDLLPGNLLVANGTLAAVIDWNGLAVGDPACDLMCAWALFDAESRTVFRSAMGVDDATWARGRGHALAQALIFIPYYRTSNPAGVINARRSLRAVLADYQEDCQ